VTFASYSWEHLVHLMVRPRNALTVVRRYGATQLGIERLITKMFVTDLNAAGNAVDHFPCVLPNVRHCDGHIVFAHRDADLEIVVVKFNPRQWRFRLKLGKRHPPRPKCIGDLLHLRTIGRRQRPLYPVSYSADFGLFPLYQLLLCGFDCDAIRYFEKPEIIAHDGRILRPQHLTRCGWEHNTPGGRPAIPQCLNPRRLQSSLWSEVRKRHFPTATRGEKRKHPTGPCLHG